MYRTPAEIRRRRSPEPSLDPPDCDCGQCEYCIRLEEEAEERDYWLECKADAERDERGWIDGWLVDEYDGSTRKV